MDNYFETLRNQLRQLSSWSAPVELVVGNESCDLDSAVSAVGLAFIKHIQYKSESKDQIVIPLLNITRNELQLKTEVIFWFENSIHLSPNVLICRDDIDFEVLKTKKLLITLVDHNLDEEMSKMGQIIEIIDHHKYDPRNCPVSDPSKVLIDESIGSCSTLIAERFLATDLKSDTQLALMFYGPIILDTNLISNDIKPWQRCSEKDLEIVLKLETIIGGEHFSRKELYDQLLAAKNSTTNLTFDQLLMKDKKVIPHIKVIISTLPGLLVSDMGLEDKRQHLRDFCSNESNRFDAIIILGIDNKNPDNVRRDLAVFTDNTSLMEKIISKLESEKCELQLSLIKESTDLRIYKQNNLKATRKQVLPLISSIHQTNSTVNESNESPNRKKLLKALSTADVDPDFALNYICETIDFLESPQYQYKSMETEVLKEQYFSSSPSKETTNGSPNTKTNTNESELEIPNSDVSKPNPESVYGSYIEDSFVGELVGDYPNNETEREDNDLDNPWSLNNGINNELEFDFDSFGPESIVFTGNSDNLEQQNGVKSSLSEETLSAETNANELISSETKEHENENPDNEENGSKTPVQSLLDIPKLTSDSDINQSTGEERDEITAFKRNTSLTISQRRKISPKISIQQILNSSDDLASPSTPTEHPLATNSTINDIIFDSNTNNDKNANSLNSSEDKESKGLVRRPSTTKKKIPVNRELFISDEMNDKTRSGESSQQIEELTARQESEETRAWKESCPIGPEGDVKPIDMKVIDPYKKVISHGGYFHSCTSGSTNGNSHQSGSSPAIIVFSACYMPDRSRKDYNYVMDHLFMYVLTTLHNLIADDYILIYLHNAGVSSQGNNMPTFGWLKRCYYMIDRRLKKNLKGLYLVHPTFWLKTLIIMSKPFISSKFSRKLKFVNNLGELSALLPIEHIAIPEPVKTYDDEIANNVMTDSLIMNKQKKSQRIRH